ncbi:unnamed protein product [Dicrocoelium dendriticum]|nr:unnamed protein product [Dicrocoelium dendriticum]
MWLASHFRRNGAFWSRLIHEDGPFQKGFIPPYVNSTAKRKAHEVFSRSVLRKLKALKSFGRSRCSTVDHQETDEQVAFTSAAALFSELFYDADLVATDIVAGLFLLRWQTNQWVGGGHCVPMSLIERDTIPCDVPPLLSVPSIPPRPLESGDVISPRLSESFEINWLSIQRIQRMSQFTCGIYGRLLYHLIYRFEPTSLCRLCNWLSSLRRSSASHAFTLECCLCSKRNCDLAALLELAELHPDDIITVDFHNTLHQSPFFVALDDRTHCIVVVIRGTLSVEDVVADFLYDAVRLTEIESLVEAEMGSKPTFLGHRGMVNRARRLHQRLLASGWIDVAKRKRPHYPLVVCGHSLGAGIASFLVILLRPMYPEVKGYAFSCPLGTMNSELCAYTKPFLLSIIYGFDAIARMNKATMIDFKWRLLDALSASHIPKYRIISRGVELCLLRSCYKGCSTCFCPTKSPPKIGEDTHLLSPIAQNRLIYPNPDIPARLQETWYHFSAEAGDVERVQWPSRLVPGTRSLLRWISSENSQLLYTTSNPLRVEPAGSASGCHSSDPEGSMELLDGSFGGLILHIVDVCPNKNEHGAQRTGSGDPLPPLDPMHEPDSCCYSHKTPTANVAVWTTSDQFRTVLIHPRMFIDHLPHNVLRAINRVHSEIIGDPVYANHGIKPTDVIRKLK